ncbi:UNVERIFIED_CONTAM: hypothetical protein Slati_1913200, partial [Sesamum latifolium]
MISVAPSTPKFGALNHRPMVSLMLGSNCIRRLPHRPILPTSTPGFRASRFTSTSPFPPASSFRVLDAHHRFSSKKWKISCFRHDELPSGSPKASSAEEILHKLDKAHIKPNVERKLATSLREKWKISCFRHEELPSGSPKSSSAEEILHELDNAEIKPNVERRNWATSLKEVLDTFFREIGKSWTVPWTAETILQ